MAYDIIIGRDIPDKEKFGKNRIDFLNELAEYLLKKGILEKWIKISEDFPNLPESLDTFNETQNAYRLAGLLQVKKLAVISDASHLAQVKLLFYSFY